MFYLYSSEINHLELQGIKANTELTQADKKLSPDRLSRNKSASKEISEKELENFDKDILNTSIVENGQSSNSPVVMPKGKPSDTYASEESSRRDSPCDE